MVCPKFPTGIKLSCCDPLLAGGPVVAHTSSLTSPAPPSTLTLSLSSSSTLTLWFIWFNTSVAGARLLVLLICFVAFYTFLPFVLLLIILLCLIYLYFCYIFLFNFSLSSLCLFSNGCQCFYIFCKDIRVIILTTSGSSVGCTPDTKRKLLISFVLQRGSQC